MSHLSPAEFVELVEAADGALAPARAAHLATCAACRDQAARVSSTLGTINGTRGADVPEPSPLYWAHLSAHVRARVADERITPAWRAGWRDVLSARHLVPVASALALAGAVMVSGLMTRDRHAAVSSPPALMSSGASADASGAFDESEAWQMLTSAAAETPIEDAHAAGMGVPVGAVDRAVLRMTPDELDALGQLLGQLMKADEPHRSGD